MRYTIFIAFALVYTACSSPSSETWIAEAPAGERYTAIDRSGETVLPLGRVIKPYGKTFTVAPHPFGLTLTPDGQTAITANSGTAPLSISIIRDIRGASPEIQQVPEGYETDRGILESVFMGLAVSPDQSRIYVAGGQANSVYVFDLATGTRTGEIDVSSPHINHGYSDVDNACNTGFTTKAIAAPMSSSEKRYRILDEVMVGMPLQNWCVF